jgi:hypothetical protein
MDPEHPPVTARQPFKLVPVKAHHSLGAHALITWGYSGLSPVQSRSARCPPRRFMASAQSTAV